MASMATSTPGMSAPKRTIARAGFRAREKFRVGLVHLFVQVGPRQQYGDLYDAVERTAGGFEDGLDVAQRLAGLSCMVAPTISVGPPPGLTGICAETNTKPLATTACEQGECAADNRGRRHLGSAASRPPAVFHLRPSGCRRLRQERLAMPTLSQFE